MNSNKYGKASKARRTIWKKGWTAVLASVLILLCAFRPLTFADDGVGQDPIDLPDLSEVQCASYFAYDRTTGTVLLDKDADAKIYPASMTKILTLALAMEYLSPDEVVTVSQTAMDATTPNSTMMGLVVGEEVTVNDLYYGLMLPSGNDAANVLAEAIATKRAQINPLPTPTPDPAADPNGDGTGVTISLIGQFAIIANEKIAQLGLSASHFINPNGLQNDEHYTTARELAMMFDYALGFEDFRTVISTPSHAFKATNKHTFDGWKIVRNTNFLLQDPWILGPDTHCAEIFGGKTGTTKVAGTGMTLLTINQNGHEVITSVCGIPYDLADRQTTYVATVVNAAHDVCWESDPTVRVDGNVMDYRPYNAPEGQEPSGEKSNIQIGTPTPEPSQETQPEQTQVVPAETTITPIEEKEEQSLFEEHPVLVIILIVLSIVVVGLIFFTVISVSQAKRRRKRMGVRKVR
ncbi:MAG: D-alanyl-D-alanine carboxypeptidase [Clostridiales bacterium]|nr:D-alanyl-D-alanine carboxypeptidase [Clostridiales bacterium]